MKNAKTKKIIISVAAALLAAAVLALVFLAGYWTRGAVGSTSYDWVLGVIADHYYKDVDASSADEIAIDALVDEYLDIYSEYYTAEEYAAQQQSNAGVKSGLGVSYSYIPGSGITIISCVGNSPAYRAGLRSGDVVLYGVKDGVRTDFGSSSDFSSFVSSLADGEEAEFVCASGKSCTIAKEVYSASYVFMATNDSAWTFTGSDALQMTETEGDAISYLPEGAAYISLSQFYGGAPQQFKTAVEKFNELGLTSLVLDLRNNGGGSVSVMQKIAGCFPSAAGKTALVARSKSGDEKVYEAESYSSQYTLPEDVDVYILANGSTASASEALTGVLVSYGIAGYGDIYISEYSQEYLSAMGLTAEEAKSGRTYGKGIMQTTYEYVTGEALKLTTHQIYWPNGESIHDMGLSQSDGCNLVSAPLPLSGDGEELRLAVGMIYG